MPTTTNQQPRTNFGLVGEETNKLVCYLACVSRLLPQPLSVLIQSSSAAGKTALLEATLQFMPSTAQVRWSALTSQALYYLGREELQHKILAVAEAAGVAEASYALKLLQSEGRLSLAVAGKDSDTGRPQTHYFEVEGPVALLLTTTADEPDGELANRCLILSVNEQPPQTQAIHRRQRTAYTREGHRSEGLSVRTRQQHAQQLLEPLGVIIPWAEQLTFRSDQTRYRRDHAKYLTLIASLALLHQYQRQQTTCTREGTPERCVIATLEDLQRANQLAIAALAPRLDALLPQTCQLLEQLHAYVTERCAQAQVPRHELRFSQRELRVALGWQDRALRRQLARLVELEYVVVYRTGRGNQRVYQWWPAALDTADSATRLGLTDFTHLSPGPPH
ncbi:MAG: helix-turn-helix transcriptional regulator [Pirellulaceae bacterium]